jgi:hypothetical protein
MVKVKRGARQRVGTDASRGEGIDAGTEQDAVQQCIPDEVIGRSREWVDWEVFRVWCGGGGRCGRR